MMIDNYEINGDLFSSKLTNINVGRLETVGLVDINIPKSDVSVKISNLILSFVLQSCPNLKNLVLNADQCLNPRGINLDFRRNRLLQHIQLNMPNCQYYTFHHEFGKYWRDINDEITQEDFARSEKKHLLYHVNLAWDASTKINLQLTGCGL